MYEKLEEEFIKKGCTNKRNIAISTQVYLELSEVKKYWDIEFHYNSNLVRLYFTARRKKNEDPVIFMPVEVSEGVSFNNFQNFFKLCRCEIIYLAIVNSDSTCVFYQISNGLCEPSESSQKILKDHSQKLDKDLKKHRQLLEQAALYGISITLPKASVSTTPSDEAGTSSR